MGGRTREHVEYTVALGILDELIRSGVDTCFGIPGGAVAPFYAALLHRPKIRYVNAAHECGAVFMAMGYARATGRPALVLTTAGPGVTNTITGVVSTWIERLPMILISGEVSTKSFGKGAVQESNSDFHSVQLMRPMTRYAAMVLRPNAAVSQTRRAIASATSTVSGPSYLSVPFDIASTVISKSAPISGRVSGEFEVRDEVMAELAHQLKDARKPLIIAGAGCRNAKHVLQAFVRHFSIPVATTPRGKGVYPENLSLALGVVGIGGNPSVQDYVDEEVDLILVLGTPLDDLATNAWTLPLDADGTKLVQVDSDADVIGKTYAVDLGITAPVATVLSSILQHAPDSPRTTDVERRVFDAVELDGALDGPMVASIVNETAPDNAVFTADTGEHMVASIHHIQIRSDRDWYSALGFGSMGSGVCAAVGLQIGNPDKPVFAMVGDASFLMINELTTAVREKVPVTYVVFNDSCMNMCVHGMNRLYDQSQNFSTKPVDFAKLARAVGADGVVVKTGLELRGALCVRSHDRPRVIDAQIERSGRISGSDARTDGLAMQGAHDG